MSKTKVKSTDNIELNIHISEYRLVLNIPKETRVSEVLAIVQSYDKIHAVYGPENAYFIGLASTKSNYVIDYLLTKHQTNFLSFGKRIDLKALYSIEKKIDKLSINNFEFL